MHVSCKRACVFTLQRWRLRVEKSVSRRNQLRERHAAKADRAGVSRVVTASLFSTRLNYGKYLNKYPLKINKIRRLAVSVLRTAYGLLQNITPLYHHPIPPFHCCAPPSPSINAGQMRRGREAQTSQKVASRKMHRPTTLNVGSVPAPLFLLILHSNYHASPHNLSSYCLFGFFLNLKSDLGS